MGSLEVPEDALDAIPMAQGWLCTMPCKQIHRKGNVRPGLVSQEHESSNSRKVRFIRPKDGLVLKPPSENVFRALQCPNIHRRRNRVSIVHVKLFQNLMNVCALMKQDAMG